MGAVSSRAAANAAEIVRHSRRDTDTSVGDVLAEIAKNILWLENTAPQLAAAIGKLRGRPCPVRTAERYLGGECEWSGDATAAIVTEILARRKMRNVKIVPQR